MAAQEGMVLVELSDNNVSKHSVYGPATKQYYGYRKHGDRFYVWSKDADLLGKAKVAQLVNDDLTPPAPPEPEQAQEELASLWGVDEARADKLREAGLATYVAIGAADVTQIVDLLEVSEATAKRIKAEANKVAHSLE